MSIWVSKDDFTTVIREHITKSFVVELIDHLSIMCCTIFIAISIVVSDCLDEGIFLRSVTHKEIGSNACLAKITNLGEEELLGSPCDVSSAINDNWTLTT